MTLPLTNSATTHSAEAILAEYLVQNGYTTGYELRVNGATSDTPNELIVLTGDGSLGTTETLTDGTVGGGAVQIRVRGNPDRQLEPRALAIAIYRHLDTLLHGAVAYEGSTYDILAIHILSGPMHINTDDQRRWEWVLNVKADITQLT